jgi:hypothetical protein
MAAIFLRENGNLLLQGEADGDGKARGGKNLQRGKLLMRKG